MPTPGLKLTSTENDDLEELFGCDATAEPTAAATAKGLARSVRSVWEYGTHAWIKHEVDHEVSLTVR